MEIVNRNFLKKSEMRLNVAKWSVDSRLLCASISNAYFSLFNLMQAVVGKPEKGRWEHIGISKQFVNRAKNWIPMEALKGINKRMKELYGLRVKADYEDYIFREDEVDLSREMVSYVEGIINLVREGLNHGWGE